MASAVDVSSDSEEQIMPRITNSLAEEHAKFNHKNLTDNMDDDYNEVNVNNVWRDGDNARVVVRYRK